ncbi:hypothetical protein HY493_01095 [Candidatus Woesearchaeota archaeon]|nr:hypothetical protein [Candidatus Woesearchaeota archaeon]
MANRQLLIGIVLVALALSDLSGAIVELAGVGANVLGRRIVAFVLLALGIWLIASHKD